MAWLGLLQPRPPLLASASETLDASLFLKPAISHSKSLKLLQNQKKTGFQVHRTKEYTARPTYNTGHPGKQIYSQIRFFFIDACRLRFDIQFSTTPYHHRPLAVGNPSDAYRQQALQNAL
jgi:hypothetical protein